MAPGSAGRTIRCVRIGSGSVVRNGRPLLQSLHRDRLEDSAFPVRGWSALPSRSSVVFSRPYSCTVHDGPHAAAIGSLDP